MKPQTEEEIRRTGLKIDDKLYLNSGDEMTEAESQLNDNNQVIQLSMKPYDHDVDLNTTVFTDDVVTVVFEKLIKTLGETYTSY